MKSLLILCLSLLISPFLRAGELVEVTATLIKINHPSPESLSQIELHQQFQIGKSGGADDLLQLASVVESGKWASIKRGRDFWYPAEYSDAKIYQAAGDDGTYTIPTTGIASGNSTIIIPNSPTRMTNTELGASLRVRPTVKEDGLIYIEGQFKDTVFEGLSDESIPIKVETRQLIRQNRVHEIMTSRIDKPLFRRVEKEFAEMLPYAAGTSRNAKLLREAQSKYTYFIPIVLGNTAFGAPGKIELKEEANPTGPIRSTVMKATMVKDFFIRPKAEQTPREHGILRLEVKKVALPEPAPAGSRTDVYITSKFFESRSAFSFENPVFNDATFQSEFKKLNSVKGTDIVSAPSVMVRSGQTGKIQVCREFIFPTAYSAPFFHESEVAPATPDEFKVINVGVSLDVTASVESRNFIRLKIHNLVNTFEGMLEFGNPIMSIKSGPIKKLKPVVDNENSVIMPVFPFRETETEILVPNGAHVAVTMIFDYHNTNHQQDRLLRIGKAKVEEVKTPRYLTVVLSPKIAE